LATEGHEDAIARGKRKHETTEGNLRTRAAPRGNG